MARFLTKPRAGTFCVSLFACDLVDHFWAISCFASVLVDSFQLVWFWFWVFAVFQSFKVYCATLHIPVALTIFQVLCHWNLQISCLSYGYLLIPEPALLFYISLQCTAVCSVCFIYTATNHCSWKNTRRNKAHWLTGGKSPHQMVSITTSSLERTPNAPLQTKQMFFW